MKAIPGSSLLLLSGGGAVSIDGVLVTERESLPSLLVGERYLVFVRLDDNTDGTFSRVARFPLGDRGIYTYNQQADTFGPLTPNKEDPFVKDLLERSAGSFRELIGSIRRAMGAR
jgi:hypothetical protein